MDDLRRRLDEAAAATGFSGVVRFVRQRATVIDAGCWVRDGSAAVTMSRGDAGVAFWSRHDPEAAETITVIGNTGRPLDPLGDLLDAAL
jgi:hypothetical protein